MQVTKAAYAFICAALMAPQCVLAYSEGAYYSQSTYYSQPYYQGYYQGYYQSTYQSTYQTTFSKNVSVSGDFLTLGSIAKGSGTFVIDHPLDPENKLLYHSFVESPDVKDLYDGIVVLDAEGEATVRLPKYFDALNKDVRYQLKPIGAPMPDLHVKEEEQNNQFTIGGGVPGGRVSWQVTGIRHDAYIEANPIVPEVEKGPGHIVGKGEYLFEGNMPKFPLSGLQERLRIYFSDLFGMK